MCVLVICSFRICLVTFSRRSYFVLSSNLKISPSPSRYTTYSGLSGICGFAYSSLSISSDTTPAWLNVLGDSLNEDGTQENGPIIGLDFKGGKMNLGGIDGKAATITIVWTKLMSIYCC